MPKHFCTSQNASGFEDYFHVKLPAEFRLVSVVSVLLKRIGWVGSLCIYTAVIS